MNREADVRITDGNARMLVATLTGTVDSDVDRAVDALRDEFDGDDVKVKVR